MISKNNILYNKYLVMRGVSCLADMYFVECSVCGFQVNVVIDSSPDEDEKITCDACKEPDSKEWFSF